MSFQCQHPPPFFSLYLSLSSAFFSHSFILSYYCTSISICLLGQLLNFQCISRSVVCMPRCSFRRYPLTLSLPPWPSRGGSDWKKRMKGQLLETETSVKETDLIMLASSSCLSLLYQIQSDAGMSGVFLLFDYLSVSLSIRHRQAKSYHYLNHLF